MMIVRIYKVEKQEYMVMDGTTGFMPGAAAIRLLAHRRFGVGADRVLIFTGSEEIPSFKAFTADGEEQEMQEADYAALAKVKEDMERDYWMNAEEAVKYGLVDRVVRG